jgi:hypothetical protein
MSTRVYNFPNIGCLQAVATPFGGCCVETTLSFNDIWTGIASIRGRGIGEELGSRDGFAIPDHAGSSHDFSEP